MDSGIFVLIAAGCWAFFIITNVIMDLIHYHRLNKMAKEHEEDNDV